MNKITLTRILILSTFLATAACSQALAGTFYVSSDAKADGDGSKDKPFASVEAALANTGGGHTIVVRPGVYRGPIQIPRQYAGTKEAPTIIKSEVKWKAIIVGAPVHAISNGGECHWVTIDGFQVQGARYDGIKMNGDHNVVRNCWVHNNQAMGIAMHARRGGVIENNLIEFNGSHIQFDHGVYASGEELAVRGNVVRHNAGFGLHLYPSLKHSIIENNVVHGQVKRRGIIVACPTGGGENRIINNTVVDDAPLTIWNGDGEVVANNILVASQDEPIVLDDETRNVLVEYNLCTPKSSRQGANGTTGNPMFVDATKGLFWLRADSPARGKGSSVHAPETDFWGRSRGKDRPPDLGAMPFIAELAQAEARQRFEFGWAYYRHGSGGTIPDLWLLPRADFQVDCDYPGGNIIVDRIEGDQIYVHQDLRDTRGDWFYWNFRVQDAANRTLTVHFTGSNVIGVRGPAVSGDGGKSWRWLGAEAVRGQSFRYTPSASEQEVRFCFAMPYVQSDLDQFLRPYRQHPNVRFATLGQSKTGRNVERLHLGRLDGEPDHRVLITCRHHCCEMMASYSLEGLLSAVLADSEDGRWFREHVELLVIPFMDKDGVEDGDQGKNRQPRDHNRDYIGESVHPEVKALREFVPEWSNGRLRFALDMHNPWIRGNYNEIIYLVENDGPATEHVRRFARIVESSHQGLLPFRAADNLAFGQAWNIAANYAAGMSFARWAGAQPNIRFAATIEIPYANVSGQAVTPESARAFGADLARALRTFLESER